MKPRFVQPKLRLAALLAVLWALPAQAGSFFNISVDGSYQRTLTEDSETTQMSLGGELGIPITSFFELAFGHTLSLYRDDYTDAYREKILQYYMRYGVQADQFPTDLMRETTVVDSVVNAVVGYQLGYVKPTVFAGKMWRKVCREDTFEDEGCGSQESTWNAGLGMAVYLTSALRLRLSYRVSPSSREDDKSTFDDRFAVGLTWGL